MTTDATELLTPKTTAPSAPATSLTVIERADLALGASQTKIDLIAMVAKSANIVEIKDAAGRTECHRAAMALADARIAIAKTGKAARDDAVKFGKAVIAAEQALIAITLPEEGRLLGIRNVWDDKVEAEKAAAAAAEQARVTGIMARIDEFRSFADLAVQSRTSAMVDKLIDRLTALPVGNLDEFHDQGTAAVIQTLARMKEIGAAKKAEEDERARVKAEQETEAARLAAERAELARLQAEAAAARAKASADLQADQDAHAARVKAENEAQAAELQRQSDADAADLKARQDAFAAEMAAENSRRKAEREAQQAEAARLQAQAAELERQRAELEPKPVLPSAEWSPAAMETSMEKVVEMLEDDSVTAIPATLLVAAAAELDADPLPVTMAAPAASTKYNPSDADVLQTAMDALWFEYELTSDDALARLIHAINASA